MTRWLPVYCLCLQYAMQKDTDLLNIFTLPSGQRQGFYIDGGGQTLHEERLLLSGSSALVWLASEDVGLHYTRIHRCYFASIQDPTDHRGQKHLVSQPSSLSQMGSQNGAFRHPYVVTLQHSKGKNPRKTSKNRFLESSTTAATWLLLTFQWVTFVLRSCSSQPWQSRKVRQAQLSRKRLLYSTFLRVLFACHH